MTSLVSRDPDNIQLEFHAFDATAFDLGDLSAGS
jgi:hypothetical protein